MLDFFLNYLFVSSSNPALRARMKKEISLCKFQITRLFFEKTKLLKTQIVKQTRITFKKINCDLSLYK